MTQVFSPEASSPSVDRTSLGSDAPSASPTTKRLALLGRLARSRCANADLQEASDSGSAYVARDMAQLCNLGFAVNLSAPRMRAVYEITDDGRLYLEKGGNRRVRSLKVKRPPRVCRGRSNPKYPGWRALSLTLETELMDVIADRASAHGTTTTEQIRILLEWGLAASIQLNTDGKASPGMPS